MKNPIKHDTTHRSAYNAETDIDRPNEPGAVESCCQSSSCCAPAAPISRLTPKIGRNDPCPCDSGRKFKKCCGLY